MKSKKDSYSEYIMTRMSGEGGYTVSNLLVTMGLIAVLSTTAIANLREMHNPLSDASFSVEHFLRLARSRALSQTEAIQVSPSSAATFVASSSDSCTGIMTPVANLSLTLPSGASLADTSWSICFTQRGLADANTTFDLLGSNANVKSVSIALGGGIKIE